MPRPYSSSIRIAALCLAPTLFACTPSYEAEQAQATAVAQQLVAACPIAGPDDVQAQQACALALARNTVLRDAMQEPFLWGQQTRLWEYDLATFRTTRFNPMVFRRMYLSLFMFTGGFTVEQVGERTIVHVPYEFRSGLDPGAYPYPFWHLPAKWRDYQLATELHLVFRGGRFEGAMRSAVRLQSRPQTTRRWDGQWTWANGAEPHVALFRNLFAPGNPHVEPLETAYRALEGALRPYNCVTCHRPDNPAGANPLVLFSYPNQALVARHDIRAQIELGRMPPSDGSVPPGVIDSQARAELIRLARAFELVADQALAAESEGTPDAGD